MNTLKKSFIWICVLAITSAILIGTILYIKQDFISEKLKCIITKNIESFMDRKVHIERLKIGIFRGVEIHNLSIYAENRSSRKILEIKNINLPLVFLPSFKRKALIIPKITVDGAYLHIIRETDKIWNFNNPPLFGKKDTVTTPSASPKSLSLNILPSYIKIVNSKFHFIDQTKKPIFNNSVSNINGNLQYRTGSINFQIYGISDIDSSDIEIKGSYLLDQGLLKMSFYTKNMHLKILSEYILDDPTKLKIESGLLSVSSELSIDKDEPLDCKFNISAKGILAHIKNEDVELKGDLNLDGNLKLNITDISQITYKITANLNRVSITGLTHYGAIKNLKGKLHLTEKKIEIKKITLMYKDVPFEVYNSLYETEKSLLFLKIITELDLREIKNLLPSRLLYEPIQLDGPASLNLNLTYHLRLRRLLTYSGMLKLNNTELLIKNTPFKAKNIKGKINFSDDKITADNISFIFANDEFIASASLSDIKKTPFGKIEVSSQKYYLNTNFFVQKSRILFRKSYAKVLNSEFIFGGHIRYVEKPYLKLYGSADLSLKDINHLIPIKDRPPFLNRISGMCHLNYKLTGPFKKPHSIMILAKCQVENLLIDRIKIDEAGFNIVMKDGILNITGFQSLLYDGLLKGELQAEITKKDIPFHTIISASNIDLRGLVNDISTKKRDISGKIYGSISLNGSFKRIETLTGDGSFRIHGGKLWSLPLLGGIAKLLDIPRLSDVTFDEAKGNFYIKRKHIFTDNTTLHSPKINLIGRGSIGFDRKLNILVTTSILETLIDLTPKFGKIASIFISQAGSLFGEIRITGTIDKPRYSFVVLPIEKIFQRKFKELFFDLF